MPEQHARSATISTSWVYFTMFMYFWEQRQQENRLLIFFRFEVGRLFDRDWGGHYGGRCSLVIYIQFLDLWTLPMGNRPIRSVWWCAPRMHLVCIADGFAAIVFDFFAGRRAARTYSVLCRYSVLTGHIQKGHLQNETQYSCIKGSSCKTTNATSRFHFNSYFQINNNGFSYFLTLRQMR